MKKIFIPVICFFLLSPVFSQTLFTYGKYSVDAKEFLRAFNKNYAVMPSPDRRKAMREYLDLFINSKLKVREAYARRYDTFPSFKMEIENLRLQITDTYLNDPAALENLTREAFLRSQKDIHAAHIFISFTNADGKADPKAAEEKKQSVISRLTAGEDFMKLAAEVSDDPSAKINKGDLGFVTVFTLPYLFETILYSTPAGKFSGAYRSRSGWHIFKNIEERKAFGKMKAQQILLAYPPGSGDTEKKEIKNRGDSLYNRILAGDDFSKLAAEFSNDYITSAAHGNMQTFGVGHYEPVFEKIVFSLSKDGDITKPFETNHGYHIVKRTSHVPVVSDSTNTDNWSSLRSSVNNIERTAASQKAMMLRVQKMAGFKQFPYKPDVLQAYTDSVLNNTPAGIGAQQNPNAGLFKIGDSTFTVNDWVGYAQVFRFNTNGGFKSHEELMEEFIQANVMQYYRENLEKYNEGFRNQMNEFRDGNLFFEIMQRDIWNLALSDSTGLRMHFENNKSKYRWNNSADAVVFNCIDELTAGNFYLQLLQNPSGWKTILSGYEERVSYDSARIETESVQKKNTEVIKPGLITVPVINSSDKTATITYILKLYPESQPRTYEEARGLVLNDYQAVLDKKWIEKLRKKYPVIINEAIFKTLK